MNMIIDNELLLNQERIACLCVCAVIAHLLASRFLGAKVQVFPQLKISVCRAYLTKCDDNNVVNCLKFGWPINYGSAFCRLLLVRIITESALTYADDVNHYLQIARSFGAIAGPFQYNPYMKIWLHPLCKRNSTKRRDVMDLSFPCWASINDGIWKINYLDTAFELRLPSIEHLRNFIVDKAPGCYVLKKDFKRGYRQFPIDTKDYKFLGYIWDKALYFYTRCPFGLR